MNNVAVHRVKTLVGRVVRKLAPETMRTLEYAGDLRRLDERLPGVVRRVDDLQTRMEGVEHRLAELDGVPLAVDELRRDSLRVAELTDLVVTALGTLPRPAGERRPPQ
ncbi:hypothetical protein [Cryobacterium arcticum]|uniref:Uncharacterized protein n=1 Tax=Cryobacterium arcticum TaxID=670052 RepID=A0A1B1BF17_9MICO|nr:hypothetical protein [Cryobacterium arcticum]ANP71170.1 hypothetical protein PA27867_0196 [Cryobacterium arcticum]